MNRFLKKAVSAVLAVTMAFSGTVSTFATNDETIHYVALGASNTNGYGIDGYLPRGVHEDPLAASKADMNVYGYEMLPAEAYPAQIADALGAEEVHQLAISSMRVEEVRYLLDDTMETDDYMDWRFTGGQNWFAIAEPGGIDELKKAYRTTLKNADYVTVDLGWNNFGVYAFNNIKTILADGNFWKAPDFEKMFPDYAEPYHKIKNQVLGKLSESMSGSSASLKDKLDLLADVLTYATMGACFNYDIVMDKIYDLNPDADVAVINIQNLADDLVVEFEGVTLPLGDIYGELIDLVNLYRATESPYADEIIYVDAGDVETFLDELVAWDGDPTTLSGDVEDCFDMYDDNLYVRSIVEYMMVGQAMSGLFQGFRDMAAGYGLEVFKNDDQYTYEFALTRSPEELLSLDLGNLDLNNPAGDDADVEAYGKALAPHLKNLRGEEANVAAYEYVFENLLAGLEVQRDQLEAVKDLSAEYAEQYALVNQAITTIIPAAKAEFANKLQGVYTSYHNTLDHAYDVVATTFQYVAGVNDLEFDADSLNGFNSKADTLMNFVFATFVNDAQNKFYYELEKNGVQVTGAPDVPEFVLNPEVAGLNDPAAMAIAVLAVRYELGNSFFAHPNPAGHDQITSAVMDALENGSDAKDFTDKKVNSYLAILEKEYPNLYNIIMGLQGTEIEHVDELAAIFALLKMSDHPQLAAVDLDRLEKEIRAAYRDAEESKSPEEMAEAQAAVKDLMYRVYKLATIATSSQYTVTEDSYYVSLGDSTISGYGLAGYIDNMQNGVGQVVADSAHVLLAQQLYGETWKEQFGVFTQGSLRADDLLIFLGGGDEAAKDDYYYAEIEPNLMEGTLEATQAKFIENVKDADLVSVAVGGGNLLTFVGKHMNRVMGTAPGGKYELDWARIGLGPKDTETIAELNEVLDLMVPIIDELGLLDQYVPEDLNTLEKPAEYARELAEALLYGIASYSYYYPQVLERIKEINPDAQLLILGMFNPVDDWSMHMKIEGQDVALKIGDALAGLMSAANIYSMAFAMQNPHTSFVDISEAETILEAEKPGKELTFNDYYGSSFKSNGKAVHASVKGHQYISKQMHTALDLKKQIFTVFDELIYIGSTHGAFLLEMLEEYGPEIMGAVFQYAKENGYVDMALQGLADFTKEQIKILIEIFNTSSQQKPSDPEAPEAHECVKAQTVVEQEATCSEAGLMIHYCECGKVVEAEVIPALGHDMGDNGVCGRCGYEDYIYDEEEEEVYIASSDLEELIKDAEDDTVTIKVDRNTRIASKAFELLRTEYPETTLILKGDGYTLSIKGEDIVRKLNKSFDTDIRDTTPYRLKIRKLVGDDATVQYIHSDFHGKLPGEMTLTVKVDKELRGKELNCYHYNNERDTMELIASNLKADDKNYVSIEIDHFSTYILTDATLTNVQAGASVKVESTVSTETEKANPSTGASDMVGAAVAMAVVSVMGATALSKKR